jgi:hypothetical protein
MDKTAAWCAGEPPMNKTAAWCAGEPPMKQAGASGTAAVKLAH